MACAGDDEAADGGGVANGRNGRGEGFLSSPVESVALLGAVDTQEGNACVVVLEFDAHSLSVAGRGRGSSLGILGSYGYE